MAYLRSHLLKKMIIPDKSHNDPYPTVSPKESIGAQATQPLFKANTVSGQLQAAMPNLSRPIMKTPTAQPAGTQLTLPQRERQDMGQHQIAKVKARLARTLVKQSRRKPAPNLSTLNNRTENLKTYQQSSIGSRL